METWVRFPSPAPFSFNNLHSCAGRVQENCRIFKLFSPENGGQICAQQRAKLSKSKFRVVFISPLREEFEQRGQANRR
jgi:hypothetical protein